MFVCSTRSNLIDKKRVSLEAAHFAVLGEEIFNRPFAVRRRRFSTLPLTLGRSKSIVYTKYTHRRRA